jgi:hypothetical protein
MGPYELRPLTLGELLDRAFALYRRNFWLFAGIMIVPACLLVPAGVYYLRNNGLSIPWQPRSPQPHGTAFTLGLIFADWIIYAVAQSATTYAVADAYLGRAATVRGSYGRIRGHFWRIIGVSLNVGLRVFGLMLLLVFGAAVAGGALVGLSRQAISSVAAGFLVIVLVLAAFALAIAFSMRYALSLPAVLIEESKGSASIRRSVLLSDGRRGQIFLAVLLGILLIYAVAFLFQGPFYAAVAVTGMKGHLPLWMALAMSVSGAIGGAIAGPLLMIILVIFYYDVRIRKEAFDLQQMMASLPEANPAASASPA